MKIGFHPFLLLINQNSSKHRFRLRTAERDFEVIVEKLRLIFRNESFKTLLALTVYCLLVYDDCVLQHTGNFYFGQFSFSEQIRKRK